MAITLRPKGGCCERAQLWVKGLQSLCSQRPVWLCLVVHLQCTYWSAFIWRGTKTLFQPCEDLGILICFITYVFGGSSWFLDQASWASFLGFSSITFRVIWSCTGHPRSGYTLGSPQSFIATSQVMGNTSYLISIPSCSLPSSLALLTDSFPSLYYSSL